AAEGGNPSTRGPGRGWVPGSPRGTDEGLCRRAARAAHERGVGRMMLSVVVAHHEAIAAEGIASALARHPHITPTAAVSTAEEGEDRARGANAIALDRRL